MQFKEKVFRYWQENANIFKYFAPEHFTPTLVARDTCESGNIPLELLPNKADQLVLIAPFCAEKEDNYLYLVLLQARVTKDGQILPCKEQPLPWVPRTLTEPTGSHLFSLAHTTKVDNYYYFCPPPWEGNLDNISWCQQLQYAINFLEDITKKSWKLRVNQAGYKLLNQVAIIFIEQNVKPDLEFLKSERKIKIWNKIFSDEPSMVSFKFTEEDVLRFSNQHLAHISNKFSLSNDQRTILTAALRLNTNDVLYVRSGVGTGKTTICHELVANLWTQAIITKTKPPTIAVLRNDMCLEQLTMLDCLQTGTKWLPKRQRQVFCKTSRSDVIRDFILELNSGLRLNITCLEDAKKVLYDRVVFLYNILKQGLDAAFSSTNLAKQIDMQYGVYGGIENRLIEIEKLIDEQNKYHKHLEALQSLWVRYVGSKNRKQKNRLYLLLKRYLFAKDKLKTSKVLLALNILIEQSKKKRRILEDFYLQVRNDIKQVELAKNRYETWMQEQIGYKLDLPTLVEFLDKNLRYQLFSFAVHYWEAEFLQKVCCDNIDIFFDNKQKLEICDLPFNPLDILFVEHGEHIDPITSIYCIEGSNKLIIMGDNEALTLSRIPVAMDSMLLVQNKLLDEHDLEDLQFKGILISDGRLNELASKYAEHLGLVYNLDKQWDVAPELTECQNKLSIITKLIPHKIEIDNFLPVFSYIHVEGDSKYYLGSMKSDAEIIAMNNWLKKYEVSLCACYSKKSLADIVSIYTTFYGQYLAIKESLKRENLEINKVYMLEKPSVVRTPIVIFSSVYTLQDKGNLCFDQGMQILRNLLISVKEHLVVFGDCRIFDPKMHSASGRFAEFLFVDTERVV